MRRISIVSMAIAAFLLLGSAIRYPLSALGHRQSQPIFRAESNLVVLHVSVRDRAGRYITGLDRDAFTVIDDAKPQTIEMFSADEVPASVGFLIDNSNSMRPNRDRVIASAVEFAKHSDPRDEIFALTFNERVSHAWGPTVIGEASHAQFASAMNQAVIARGMTAIYDGILAGLEQVSRGAHTRQVLILVSDGGDNASKATQDEALRRVRESDATIYTVTLTDRLVRDGDPRLMRRLARATGGESHEPRRIEDVGEAFARISKDIRSAYTLAYAPTTSDRDSTAERRRHAVQVYVRAKDGQVLRVRTREGYFAPAREGASR